MGSEPKVSFPIGLFFRALIDVVSFQRVIGARSGATGLGQFDQFEKSLLELRVDSRMKDEVGNAKIESTHHKPQDRNSEKAGYSQSK